jgi:hypothetical protein
MYAFPRGNPGEKLSNTFYVLYLSMLRYLLDASSLKDESQKSKSKTLDFMTLDFRLTTLRWLLRRGSPLPIPNRVVKPACADGTAVMWESMSSPFFMEPQPEKVGVLFL